MTITAGGRCLTGHTMCDKLLLLVCLTVFLTEKGHCQGSILAANATIHESTVTFWCETIHYFLRQSNEAEKHLDQLRHCFGGKECTVSMELMKTMLGDKFKYQIWPYSDVVMKCVLDPSMTTPSPPTMVNTAGHDVNKSSKDPAMTTQSPPATVNTAGHHVNKSSKDPSMTTPSPPAMVTTAGHDVNKSSKDPPMTTPSPSATVNTAGHHVNKSSKDPSMTTPSPPAMVNTAGHDVNKSSKDPSITTPSPPATVNTAGHDVNKSSKDASMTTPSLPATINTAGHDVNKSSKAPTVALELTPRTPSTTATAIEKSGPIAPDINAVQTDAQQYKRVSTVGGAIAGGMVLALCLIIVTISILLARHRSSAHVTNGSPIHQGGVSTVQKKGGVKKDHLPTEKNEHYCPGVENMALTSEYVMSNMGHLQKNKQYSPGVEHMAFSSECILKNNYCEANSK